MEYKKELVKLGLTLLEKHLTAETWGNISLRDPETGKIYLTPSAMKYDEITSIMEYLTNNLSESFRLPGSTGDGNAGDKEQKK